MVPNILRPVVSGALLAVTVAGAATFQAEDVFELEYANDPRISPNAATIVYERRSNDIIREHLRMGARRLVDGAPQASARLLDVGQGDHRGLSLLMRAV